MKVILLDEDSEIAEYLHELDRDWFTTVVARGYVEGRAGIALIGFGHELAYIGRIQKTRAAATHKDGVRCSDLGYRQLPSRTGNAALDAIVRLRPTLAEVVGLLRDRRMEPDDVGSAPEVVSQEKDAVAIAMDIFGADRATIADVESGFQGNRPFLAGLRNAVLREDPMAVHDAGVFADWAVVERSAVGSVRFVKGDRSLTVINVNRTVIEEALGVDLVYYNEYFHAFVLVQYKRMYHDGGHGWIYRPDSHHDVEVQRMEKIPALGAKPADALSYRLDPGACFFKLCERVVFDAASTSLIPGLYVPLNYLAAAKDIAKGPRGGAAFGYSTLPRHINNTQFVQLVQDGWIGSVGSVSDQLRDYVEARVQDGKSVMLAIGTGRPPRVARR
jgi:hypothetical protein